MPGQKTIIRVWIEEGCITCDACETTCPDVFDVRKEDDTCVVRPEALDAEFTKPRTQAILDAVEECPTEVIRFETSQEGS